MFFLTESPLLLRSARAVRAALPLVALAVGTLMCPALARDDGRFSHLPVEVRDWFRSQKSPVSGERCCDEADGTYVEEDIRDDHYWVRWDTVGKGWHWRC